MPYKPHYSVTCACKSATQFWSRRGSLLVVQSLWGWSERSPHWQESHMLPVTFLCWSGVVSAAAAGLFHMPLTLRRQPGIFMGQQRLVEPCDASAQPRPTTMSMSFTWPTQATQIQKVGLGPLAVRAASVSWKGDRHREGWRTATLAISSTILSS